MLIKPNKKEINVTNQPNFLVYLHNFRGFAILNIVAIHAIAFAIYTCNKGASNPKATIHIANEILFHNSTIYFAVISGILFSVILKNKGYKRFYINKLKYLILPYLFLTLLFSVYKSTHSSIFILHTNAYFNEVLNNFIYGKAQFTFWYIPILVFLYLITPVLDYILTLKRGGKFLALLIIIMPLIISRVQLADLNKSDVLSLSTMIYFSGAYMAGMCFGNSTEKWLIWIKKHWRIIIAITLSVTLILLYMETVAIKNIGSWSPKSSLYYIQKMCLSGLFLLLFKTLDKKQPKWVHRVANHAFTIYFLHAFFIFLGYRFLSPLINPARLNLFYVILVASLFILISTTCSIFIAWTFKKLFGKYSRMLIGS